MHKKSKDTPIHSNGLIWLSVLFSILFWLIDSEIDSVFFSHESYVNSLQPTGMELYMRLLVAFLLVTLGYLSSRIIKLNSRLSHYIEKHLIEDRKTIELSEERLSLALISAKQGWFDLNLVTGEALVSPEYLSMLGYNPATFHASLQEWHESIHPEDRDALDKAFQECLKNGGPESMEYRRQTSKGDWIWINSIGSITELDLNRQPLRMVGIHTNINERKRIEQARQAAEEKLREQEEFFRLIADNGEDFIAVLDLDGRRRYNNLAYAQIFGDLEAIKGTDSFAEIHPDDRDRIKKMFKETVESGKGHRTDYRFVLANGNIRHMESCGGLIKNSRGEATCVVVVSHDITERKEAEEKIQSLAFHDTLTSLPNRRLLDDRLSRALIASKRSGILGALFFLDLDNFKPLNDAYGHVVGDLLLIEVADRLKKCVRELDTIARFGGDEFVILLADLDNDQTVAKSQAEIVAEKIRISLSEPYLLTVHHEDKANTMVEHRCTASIGVALFNGLEASQDEILQRADAAMYEAKEAGRNKIRFYG